MLTQFLYAGKSFVDLLLVPVFIGYKPGDASPMTRDDECFASFHIVQKLWEVHFGFRRLDFPHDLDQLFQPV
jgi:hypothetical protein